MKKLFSILLLFTLAALSATAQKPAFIILKGQVVNQQTGAPAVNQALLIIVDSLGNYPGYSNKVVTDGAGFYSDQIPYLPAITANSRFTVKVSTISCDGQIAQAIGYFYPGSSGVTIDLKICNNTPPGCVAKFKFAPIKNDQMSYAFFNTSSGITDSSDIKYVWQFGDSTSSNEQNPVHTYLKPGLYYACLSISNSNNSCNSTFCLPVVAGITDTQTCENYFSYRNDSSGTQFVFEGYVKNSQAGSWYWDFGDGSSAKGQSVSHSFKGSNNRYKVCLTTSADNTDGTPCTFTSCQEVTLYIPPTCETSFSCMADSSGGGYTFVGFAKNDQINSWKWDFGDGTTTSGQKVTHTFIGQKDQYTVCLTTSGAGYDSTSCTFSSCQNVYISIQSSCKNYFKPTTEDGLTYSFYGALESGATADYYWDFGDGISDTGQQVKHTFSNVSSRKAFNVCLTTIAPVPTTSGFDICKSISCQLIVPRAADSSCKAVMAGVPDASGYVFRFSNLSKGNPDYVNWDFGDGDHSGEQNPVHTFQKAGIYFVCLTISDTLNNCRDKTCQEVWVNMIQPVCKASFLIKPIDSAATSPGFMFINTSSPGYSGLKWSFGDGTSSTEINPVHHYTLPGYYKVCLAIWDSAGYCKDSYCKELFVPGETWQNTISGIVLAGNNPADKGLVWLIGVKNEYSAETNIEKGGSFLFEKVPPGTYYIYAMLTPGSSYFFGFMPTYYISSVSWQNAGIISTFGPSILYKVNLVSIMNYNQGNAVITGNINWTGNPVNEGAPASNVQIILLNKAGEPVAYTFSDSDGNYEFRNLEYGEYTLRAEMRGKATGTADVNLSQSTGNANINFGVNEAAITILSMDESVKSKMRVGNPYPNPVAETLNLDVNAPNSQNAVVDIFDAQGRTVHSESIYLSAGNNRISISTRVLKKGMYILRVNTIESVPIQRKFIK